MTEFLWRTGLLWRAGLPRVGLRSSPNKAECGVSDIAGAAALGAASQPNAGQALMPFS